MNQQQKPNNSSLQNKRNSFRFQIRREFIDKYFAQKRKELLTQNKPQSLNQINQIINDTQSPLSQQQIIVLNSWLQNKQQDLQIVSMLQAILNKIHDYSKQYPLNTIQIIHLIGNIMRNKHLPSYNISNQLLNKIVQDCFKKLLTSDKQYSQFFCWMVLGIYRKKSNIKFFQQLVKYYQTLITKMNFNNPILINLWAELSSHSKLLPSDNYIMQLLETKQITQISQSLNKSIFGNSNNEQNVNDKQINNFRQRNFMQNQKIEDTIYWIMEIQKNYLFYISEKQIKKQLTTGDQIQFLKWIVVCMKSEKISQKNKFHVMEILGLLINCKLSEEGEEFIFNSFIYNELMLRAKIDLCKGKRMALQVLAFLLITCNKYRIRSIIKQSDIIKVFVGHLRMDDFGVVLSMLRALNAMLEEQEIQTKRQMISSFYDSQAKYLMKSKNQQVFRLTDYINNKYFGDMC